MINSWVFLWLIWMYFGSFFIVIDDMGKGDGYLVGVRKGVGFLIYVVIGLKKLMGKWWYMGFVLLRWQVIGLENNVGMG